MLDRALGLRPGSRSSTTAPASTRLEKVERLADSEVARRTLRVCWRNLDGRYNCGRCEKCLRTMVALEALGVLRALRDASRPARPRRGGRDPSREPTRGRLLAREPRARGPQGRRPDADRRDRGLPRTTSSPSREPAPEPEHRSGPAEHRAAAARAAVDALHRPACQDHAGRRARGDPAVGSYDGSGNYGDVAQLQATVEHARAARRRGRGPAGGRPALRREPPRPGAAQPTASFDPDADALLRGPSGEARSRGLRRARPGPGDAAARRPSTRRPSSTAAAT